MAFRIKTNDTSPKLQVTLQDANGNSIGLNGASARFHMKAVGSDVLKIDASVTITNATSGVVVYTWLAADTNTSGTYYGEIEVTYGDGAIETFPNNSYFTIIIREDLD
tara:strand:- start:353 stop:676 length:324 start_codon:yes stop_codon:yes gene_type:complete